MARIWNFCCVASFFLIENFMIATVRRKLATHSYAVPTLRFDVVVFFCMKDKALKLLTHSYISPVFPMQDSYSLLYTGFLYSQHTPVHVYGKYIM